MAREAITRTAPGWEERTVTILPHETRLMRGAGEAVRLRPGFARLAFLLDAAGGANNVGLQVWVQHSPDGVRWLDLVSFGDAETEPVQVAWVEAQPELTGSVGALLDGKLAAGHMAEAFVMSWMRARWVCSPLQAFGVEAVLIYERR